MQIRLFNTIVALNAVSALAHFAQLGVLYPLVLLWLTARGVPAWEVGVVGSVFWCGMLVGSTSSPVLMHRFGPRFLLALAAILTALAAVVMPQLATAQGLLPVWMVWGLAGSLVGVATGLRWVGNESWLYSLVSQNNRGRIVGWHETLIYAAQTLGPLLVTAVGMASTASFYWAAAVMLMCIPVAFLAVVPMPATAMASAPPSPWRVLRSVWAGFANARQGMGARVGLWAGLVDGVLFGMFAVYCTQRGLSGETAAWLMVVFGAGGLLSSVPLGLLSDARGVFFALRCTCIAGFAAAGLMLLAPTLWWGAPLWLAAALLGVVACAGLTLAIIVSTQDATQNQRDMSQAISGVSLAFTLGTIVGPALAGALLYAAGVNAYAALVVVLCGAGLVMKAATVQPIAVVGRSP